MPTPGTAADPELALARKISTVLDRYMIDPIVGLVLPGAGDMLTSFIGLYTVMLAARRKVSPIVIARMLLNLSLDAVLGFIPFVGDLFDFAFKANQKNLDLLEDRHHQGGKATAKDWLAVGGAVLVFAAVVGLVGYVLVAAVRAIV